MYLLKSSYLDKNYNNYNSLKHAFLCHFQRVIVDISRLQLLEILVACVIQVYVSFHFWRRGFPGCSLAYLYVNGVGSLKFYICPKLPGSPFFDGFFIGAACHRVCSCYSDPSPIPGSSKAPLISETTPFGYAGNPSGRSEAGQPSATPPAASPSADVGSGSSAGTA